MHSETLHELTALSNRIGRPENDYAILGEGNTSALIGDDSFFVKASGAEFGTVGPDGFRAHVPLSGPRDASRGRN